MSAKKERAAWQDPVLEVYRPGVDRTLLRENLKLTPAERLEKFIRFLSFTEELRRAGTEARARERK